jgi:hypothetical protein
VVVLLSLKMSRSLSNNSEDEKFEEEESPWTRHTRRKVRELEDA